MEASRDLSDSRHVEVTLLHDLPEGSKVQMYFEDHGESMYFSLNSKELTSFINLLTMFKGEMP